VVKNIGTTANWTQIPKRSNDWGPRMNEQLVKMAAMLHGSVKSRTTVLPANPAVDDMYIDPETKRINIWVGAFTDDGVTQPAEWYEIVPTLGVKMFVEDEFKWVLFNPNGNWQVIWDMNKSHRAIEREFSWYAPGNIRKNAVIFAYVAAQEFVIEAGAPGSGASCEVAPTSDVVFNVRKNNASVGNITFLAGQTEGVVNIPNEVAVLPAGQESLYVQANSLSIISPADTHGMIGLNATIRGKIRSID